MELNDKQSRVNDRGSNSCLSQQNTLNLNDKTENVRKRKTQTATPQITKIRKLNKLEDICCSSSEEEKSNEYGESPRPLKHRSLEDTFKLHMASVRALIESMKRSLDYRIKEESEAIKRMITSNANSVHMETIMQDNLVMDLPRTTVESFESFEENLKTDLELAKKLKLFMIQRIRSSSRLSENLSSVIPEIIIKDVQLKYSAYGKENKGIKKLNFSKTETFKFLKEIIMDKNVGISQREIAYQVSRWFSGAKDREGGKKKRM